MSDQPQDTDYREQIAQAMADLDDRTDGPVFATYRGYADAVLAVPNPTVEQLRVEVAILSAKLDLPCGMCHPCNNWSYETWNQAGRKPPHVHEWDEARSEVASLRAQLAKAEPPRGEQ